MKAVCLVVQSQYEFDIRVRRKAEALASAGYCVDVLSLRKAGAKAKFTLNGVTVYGLSLGKQRGSLARYAYEYMAFFLWALYRLTIQMMWRRYEVIDVNTLPDFLVFATVFARWMGAKVILDMHEITPEFCMSKYGLDRTCRFVRLMEFLERISFRFADYVIAINEPIQDLFASRGLPKSKSLVMTNAADESRFVPYRNSPAADSAAASGGFVLMYHGTLTKTYGLDFAINAFALAHQEMPGAKFWILGTGSEANALKHLIEQRGLASKVRLMGVVAPDEIPAWLSKCDAGILPMRKDVFLEYASPNKLAEYIIMSKPVIVPRLKATQHYFGEDSLAYCEPNDLADMARQMVRLYGDRELRERLAAKANQEYAPIRWDVMKERYLNLVQHMTDPARRVAGTAKMAEPTGLPR